MSELFEKEIERISIPIEAFLRAYLLNDFKNRREQPVVKVDGFSFLIINIDEEKSEIKEKIIVNKVQTQAHVWVAIGDDGQSNNTLKIFTNVSFTMSYNFETKEYIIDSVEGVRIIDNTMY